MATASGSPPAYSKSQNSPRSRHSRLSPKACGIPSLPECSPRHPLSGNADQERNVASSFSIRSDSFPTGDARTAHCLEEDGSAVIAGVDLHPELSENGAATKKLAWNKPSNCAIAEIGSVMGADSWPALSKSARASPKVSSTDSLKALSHGSSTLSQGMSVGSVSSPKGFNSSILASNSIASHVTPTRQRSMKRGGGGSNHSSMASNGSLSQAPPMHDFVVEGSTSSQGKSNISAGESPRDNMHWDSGQRGSHVGNESHQQRGSFKRSNSGPHLRGDGSLPHGHGRRDQERGKHDWNSSHRTFGSREGVPPGQRVGSRPFIRSPIANTQFITPPPLAVPSFAPPMIYNEIPSPIFYTPGLPPDSVRYMPLFPFAPVFYPIQDLNLPSKIVSQIDYYFSNENLVKDTFLRQNMDGDGWVPINLIAKFKKMTELTDNIQLILETVQTSNVVEVQGDKVRRKGDWNKWIMPPVLYSPVTIPQPVNASVQDILASHMENASLDEKAAM